MTSHLLTAANAHSRPPREIDPRARVYSMDFSSVSGRASSPPFGMSASRPTSIPTKDPEWDLYLHERKLLQPPSGVTPPIPTTPAPRVPMSSAVQEALDNRKRRESLLVTSSGSGTPAGSTGGDDPDDVPLVKLANGRDKEREKERLSALPGVTGLGNMGYSTNAKPEKTTGPAVTILPPRRNSGGNILAPNPRQVPAREPVIKTFEELNERHREKIKNLQDPVTKAEKESADVRDAKERWQKAKKMEKETMLKKHTEKAAALKKQHGAMRSLTKRDSELPAGIEGKRQSRSVNVDKLGGNSSKRMSALKVEDWQRYQANTGTGGGNDAIGGAGIGELGTKRQELAVPFPGHSSKPHAVGNNRDREARQRRRSKDLLT